MLKWLVAAVAGLFATAMLWAVSAHPARASFYDVVFCAGGSDAGNPTLGARPGWFDFGTHCEWSVSYPSGGNSNEYLRLSANTSSGSAGYNDEASMSWYTPPWVSIVAGGGYTREPADFNQGWRARFWGEDWGGGIHNILLQGVGIENGDGITKNTTSFFASHLWPFGGWDDYKRFVFALWCVRAAGCSRAGFVAADANTITLVANDKKRPEENFVDAAIIRGEWVRGYNPLSWFESDEGSGLRFSRLKVDNATLGDGVIDYQANNGCRIGYRDGNREFGKSLQPCTLGPYQRWYGLETKNMSDGQHELAICIQDYAEYLHSEEACDRRTVHTDNTAPNKPAALDVTSANPARYLDHFDASWSLPADPGSPITKVHYDIVNSKGEVVVPTQTVSATNPTALKGIAGPSAPGAYELRVWLEDQVGFSGPAASTPIPHDTTPPAAPQDISVTSPAQSRRAQGIDVRWRNITDSGSPINAVHYQVLDQRGAVAVPTQTLAGQNVQSIADLQAPKERGAYSLRMWLSDAEGNSGAPVSVPLAYQCVRADTSAGESLSSGLGSSGANDEVVQEGEGSIVHGALRDAAGKAVSLAPLCVFSRIVTDRERQFLGFAITSSDGGYRFPIAAGASREISIVHRRDHRELQSSATLQTVVHPTFTARRRVIYNKHFARFKGEIPGPHNDRVVIVLQARVGKGWTAFRRYRTRNNGRFNLAYRFRHTFRKTHYVMRAQVRQTVGYPYLQGNSRRLKLLVKPGGRRHARRAKRRCRPTAHASAKHRKRCAKRHRRHTRRR
jgi:hypothetical protein